MSNLAEPVQMEHSFLTEFQTETLERRNCIIEGILPDIRGRLLLNGPGIFKIGNETYHTLFDGLAVVQEFLFENGQVYYRNHALRTDSYKRNMSAGRIVVHELGTLASPDPNKPFLSRYLSYLFDVTSTPTDNTSVNFLSTPSGLFALTETPLINQLDSKTLQIKRQLSVKKNLPIDILTAHPLIDEDGTIWNIGSKFSLNTKYAVIKIPPGYPLDGDPYEYASVVSEIPAPWHLNPCYYHSFSMSRKYIIFIEQPLCLPLLKIATAALRQETLLSCMTLFKEEHCHIHVIEKSSGRLLPVTYVTDCFVTLHHINAYEEGDSLIVDLCAYDDPEFLKKFDIDAITSRIACSPPVQIKRFSLPIPSDESIASLDSDSTSSFVTAQPLKECCMDMPCINLQYQSCKYRYAYGLEMKSDYFSTKLMKFDIETNDITLWSSEGYIPSSPCFVSASVDDKEDKGYILSIVRSLDSKKQSFLLILDASTMTELARVVLDVDIQLPQVFHSIFEEEKIEDISKN